MVGIGDIVAHLGIDNTGFKRGLSSSAAMLGKFATGLAGTLAGVWGVSSSISGFKEALQAQQKLSAVITATGGAAGLTTAQISDYAAGLQAFVNRAVGADGVAKIYASNAARCFGLHKGGGRNRARLEAFYDHWRVPKPRWMGLLDSRGT